MYYQTPKNVTYTCSGDQSDQRTCCKTCSASIWFPPERRISSTVSSDLVDPTATRHRFLLPRPRTAPLRVVDRTDLCSWLGRHRRPKLPPGRKRPPCRESKPLATGVGTHKGRIPEPVWAKIPRWRAEPVYRAGLTHFFASALSNLPWCVLCRGRAMTPTMVSLCCFFFLRTGKQSRFVCSCCGTTEIKTPVGPQRNSLSF